MKLRLVFCVEAPWSALATLLQQPTVSGRTGDQKDFSNSSAFIIRGRARTCREPFLSMTPEQCRRSRCPDQCLRLGPDDINLYVGVTDRGAGPKPKPVEVTKIHIHPGWDRSDPLNNITAGHRVAEVGRLSASAKNAFNSFVGRVFANSRQKT